MDILLPYMAAIPWLSTIAKDQLHDLQKPRFLLRGTSLPQKPCSASLTTPL